MARARLYSGMKTMPTRILYEATTSSAFTLTVEFAKACRFSRLASELVTHATGVAQSSMGTVRGARNTSCSAAEQVRQARRVSLTKLSLTSRSRRPAARNRSEYSRTSASRPFMRPSSVSRRRASANILFNFKVSSGDRVLVLGLYSARMVRKAWSSSQSAAPGITPFIASSTMVISSCTAFRLFDPYSPTSARGTSKGSPNSTMTRLRNL
mmetsp:Transcript_602/g.1974  ORF Transcript_602/g.1974 Transcript_602/m.1974 type:complete len:211 (-) Transcript_602:691-1323(-)